MINTRPLSPTIVTSIDKMEEQISNKQSLMTYNPTQPKRRVRFANIDNKDETDSAVLGPNTELTPEIIRDAWYSADEITNFKNSAKRTVAMKYYTNKTIKNKAMTNDNNNDDDSMLGLERYNQKRSSHKKAAMFYILQSQKKSRDPEFIRAVSQQCTAWARVTAINQGFEDFCAVYDPLDALLDSDINENFNDIFFNNKNINNNGNTNYSASNKRSPSPIESCANNWQRSRPTKRQRIISA